MCCVLQYTLGSIFEGSANVLCFTIYVGQHTRGECECAVFYDTLSAAYVFGFTPY